MVTTTSKKKGRGFASMEKEKLREIASSGGIMSARILKTAHKWTSEEAQAAGRKGGSVGKGVRRTRQTESEEEQGREEEQDDG